MSAVIQAPSFKILSTILSKMGPFSVSDVVNDIQDGTSVNTEAIETMIESFIENGVLIRRGSKYMLSKLACR